MKVEELEQTELAKETDLALQRFKDAWETAPYKVRSIFYQKQGFTRSNMTGILKNGRPLEKLNELLESLKESSAEHLASTGQINETIQAI